jgi:S1-C subfamily serine protease
MRLRTISEELLFAIVLIETTTNGVKGFATGFVYLAQRSDRQIPVIVTNRHVISGATSATMTFTRRGDEGPDIGHRVAVQIDEFEQRWFGHHRPDTDIVVMPISAISAEIKATGKQPYYRAIPESMIPTEADVSGLDALEEVVIYGYLSGFYDTYNLLPIVRRGMTATPIRFDYEGSPGFLVDAPIFPGSSGGPVLINSTAEYVDINGTMHFGDRRTYFLGVISKYFHGQGSHLQLVPLNIQTAVRGTVQQPINLGLALKSSLVRETVDSLILSGQI